MHPHSYGYPGLDAYPFSYRPAGPSNFPSLAHPPHLHAWLPPHGARAPPFSYWPPASNSLSGFSWMSDGSSVGGAWEAPPPPQPPSACGPPAPATLRGQLTQHPGLAYASSLSWSPLYDPPAYCAAPRPAAPLDGPGYSYGAAPKVQYVVDGDGSLRTQAGQVGVGAASDAWSAGEVRWAKRLCADGAPARVTVPPTRNPHASGGCDAGGSPALGPLRPALGHQHVPSENSDASAASERRIGQRPAGKRSTVLADVVDARLTSAPPAPAPVAPWERAGVVQTRTPLQPTAGSLATALEPSGRLPTSSGHSAAPASIPRSEPGAASPAPLTHKCHAVSCGAAFGDREALVAHRKMHADEKPFVCRDLLPGGCASAFKTLTSCEAHVRTHTGERPFKCPYKDCGMKFAQRSSCYRHVRLRHSNWTETPAV